ncbi:MAG: alkanesulfonate monooxygenase SsuD [Gammaproteobacteria bacterium]|jgi:alkanesulfonate monooxygenase SsuD/methylene tetrahydromethanopterin reductase-like flavin-dependent oxidoreductase (luciferase family)
MTPPKFGLTLSNRSVVLGLSDVPSMLDLARAADSDPVWDSVWLGDSIFAKPRLDAMVALGGLAAVTSRVKLGVGCMASAPLRNALLLAYQWASFDFMCNGRSIYVACQGQREAGGGQFAEEFAAFGIDPSTRSKRMEESIEIMRLISVEENASYSGEFNQFDNITVVPRPVQRPLPIWVTANPNPAFPKLRASSLKRVAELGDGWMTTANTVESLKENLADIYRYAETAKRDLPDDFEVCLYYNIRVGSDREETIKTSAEYLRAYYGVDYDRDFLERWVAMGDPARCIDEIGKFVDAGATTITLRLIGHDEQEQFGRVSQEVLKAFGS